MLWLAYVLALSFRLHPPSIAGYETSHTAPFHPAIHNMGNVGLCGRVHAHGAWFATRVIDYFAYDGRNMRAEIAKDLAERFPPNASVLEIGPGVGTLTYELLRAGFANITAFDTSAEMLRRARVNAPGARYVRGNGVKMQRVADLAIASFVMHEMPQVAHEELLDRLAQNTRRKNGEIVLIDIDPTYKASRAMLAGEPYVLKYLSSIARTIEDKSASLGLSVQSHSALDGHVRIWTLRHKQSFDETPATPTQ